MGLAGARVALVHDWLVTWGGSESVVRSLCRILPGAPLFTSVWAPDGRVAQEFKDVAIRTTWLQRLPVIHRYHRWLVPLMAQAFERLDLTGYNLVVSSSHAFSKAVRPAADALHVCYCHTPPRYLWDLYKVYNPGLAGRLRRPLIQHLRNGDLEAANRVDVFLANSQNVADRIARNYGREAVVVYPPVDVDQFNVQAERGEYYLAGGRLVPYKRIEMAVRAANVGRFPLKVFGVGPEGPRLERLAGPTVELVGGISVGELGRLAAGCRALLFPGEEDFGIVPLEVQAAGRPVIAWNRGGARETVVDGVTGVLYEDSSVEGLLEALRVFETRSWDAVACRENARRFSREHFEVEMISILERLVGGTFERPVQRLESSKV